MFDSPTGEVSFAALGRKTVFQAVKEIFVDLPLRPEPVIHREPPAAVPLKPHAPPADEIAKSAAGLIQAGVKFIESLVSAGAAGNFEQMLSSLFMRDPGTNKPFLSIPLPESFNQAAVTTAISGLLNALAPAKSHRQVTIVGKLFHRKRLLCE